MQTVTMCNEQSSGGQTGRYIVTLSKGTTYSIPANTRKTPSRTLLLLEFRVLIVTPVSMGLLCNWPMIWA